MAPLDRHTPTRVAGLLLLLAAAGVAAELPKLFPKLVVGVEDPPAASEPVMWSKRRAALHQAAVLRRAARRVDVAREKPQRQELLAVDGTKQSSEGRATPARLLLLKEFASAALSDSQASAPIAASANANATDINYDQALLLTKLAAVTQCKPENIAAWNCTRCWRVPGFQAAAMIHDKEQELLAYTGYLPDKNSIIIVFRGTDKRSFSNWIADLEAWKTDLDLPWRGAAGCRLHSGFFDAYNTSTLRPFVFQHVRQLLAEHGQDTPITVVGHSLGGALAALCAVELAVGEVPGVAAPVHLFTLGAPRVGNDAFATYAAKALRSTLRVTHGSDIVPSVPTYVMGFHHLPREIWLVDIATDTKDFYGSPIQAAVLCDGSGEDPTCHASQCYLGLCTSAYDHTHGYFSLYLGQEEAC
eukprot:jgi/Tetstr1/448023/TSEL_035324.t1